MSEKDFTRRLAAAEHYGRCEGNAQGMIESYRDFGFSDGAVQATLKAKYDLSEQRAEEYMRKYWKK